MEVSLTEQNMEPGKVNYSDTLNMGALVIGPAGPFCVRRSQFLVSPDGVLSRESYCRQTACQVHLTMMQYLFLLAFFLHTTVTSLSVLMVSHSFILCHSIALYCNGDHLIIHL